MRAFDPIIAATDPSASREEWLIYLAYICDRYCLDVDLDAAIATGVPLEGLSEIVFGALPSLNPCVPIATANCPGQF